MLVFRSRGYNDFPLPDYGCPIYIYIYMYIYLFIYMYINKKMNKMEVKMNKMEVKMNKMEGKMNGCRCKKQIDGQMDEWMHV